MVDGGNCSGALPCQVPEVQRHSCPAHNCPGHIDAVLLSQQKCSHTIHFITTPILTHVAINLKILFTLITMKDIAVSFKEKVLESNLILISVVVIYLFCWTATAF